MKKLPLVLVLLVAASPFAISNFSPAAEARPVFVDEDVSEAAVGGFDTVSYFRANGVPVKGDRKFAVTYDGADYYFANAENAAEFKANPAAFAPQYGGHCAWAMSRGALAPGRAGLYKVEGGKLYLNFSPDVQTMWLKDIPGFITKADAEWPKVPDDASFG